MFNIAVIEEVPICICVHDQIKYFKIKKIKSYLSVHLVVLVVAVDKCYPVVILLYPALALSIPVLPSSLG